MSKCLQPGCMRVAARKELCWPHYGIESGRTVVNKPEKKPCACGQKYYARNMCKSCYMTWYRSGLREDTFEPYSLHPDRLTDFWAYVEETLGVSGASTRKEKI